MTAVECMLWAVAAFVWLFVMAVVGVGFAVAWDWWQTEVGRIRTLETQVRNLVAQNHELREAARGKR